MPKSRYSTAERVRTDTSGKKTQQACVPVTSVRAARPATDDRSTVGGRRSELDSLMIDFVQS